MNDILTIHLPVPVPAIKTISRWRVFLSLFNPRAHFTTCTELRHELYRETEATGRQFIGFKSAITRTLEQVAQDETLKLTLTTTKASP